MAMIADKLHPRERSFLADGFVTPWRAGILLSVLLALLVAMWPLGFTGDYLNHLARNYIEGQVWFDSNLQRYYTVSPSVIPDLAMDMIVPWLLHVMGVYSAGAVMVWFSLAAPPLAGLILARTLHGRVTWLSLLGFLGAFNENAQWGFVNFLVSTAIAILGLAVWMRFPPGWRRALVFAPFGVFLAFCHALGFLLFGYLVLLWEIGSFASGRRGSLHAFLRQLVTKDAPAMLLGLAVLIIATGSGEGLPTISVIQFDVAEKIMSVWSGALFFNFWLAETVTIVLIGAIVVGMRRGVLSMDPRMAWACGGLLVLILVMPTRAAGIWGLHFRYTGVLIILAAASVRLRPGLAGRYSNLGAVVAMALILAVLVNASSYMARINREAEMFRSLLSKVDSGARLLAARSTPDPSMIMRSGALAVIERSAFVPSLFTNTSPVGIRREMRRQHMPQSWPLTPQELASSANLPLPPSQNGLWSPTYYYDWPRHWDYVFYFRDRPDEALHSSWLCEQASTATAVLYSVTHGSCGAERSVP